MPPIRGGREKPGHPLTHSRIVRTGDRRWWIRIPTSRSPSKEGRSSVASASGALSTTASVGAISLASSSIPVRGEAVPGPCFWTGPRPRCLGVAIPGLRSSQRFRTSTPGPFTNATDGDVAVVRRNGVGFLSSSTKSTLGNQKRLKKRSGPHPSARYASGAGLARERANRKVIRLSPGSSPSSGPVCITGRRSSRTSTEHVRDRPCSRGIARAALVDLSRPDVCHAEGRGFESLQPLF
jgi:hypothetical protein